MKSNVGRFPVSSLKPAPRPLSPLAGFLLSRSSRKIRELTESALRPLGLSPRHYGLMAAVEAGRCLTQQEAGEMLDVDRTSMVFLVDELERKGLLLRGCHPSDRRCHAIALSPKGKRLLRKGAALVSKAENEFLAPLTRSERSGFLRTLERLHRSFPRGTKRGKS